MNQQIFRSVDGGWGWVVVFASFLSNFLIDGISFSYGVLLPDLIEELQESQARISVIGSVYNGLGLLTVIVWISTYSYIGPINAYLIHRFGCRQVCILGSVLSFLGLSISSCLNSFGPLLFTYGIMGGTGMGLMYLPTIVSVSQYFERKRPLATGIALCGSGLGVIVLPPLVRLLLDCYGWRGTVILMGSFMLQGAVTGSLLRDPPVEDVLVLLKDSAAYNSSKSLQDTISRISSNFSNTERASVILGTSNAMVCLTVTNSPSKQTAEVKQQKFLVSAFRQLVASFSNLHLLKNWRFLILLLANFFLMTGFLAPIFFSVTFSLQNGISKSTSAYQLSVFGLSSTLGRLVLGYLSGVRYFSSLLVYCVALLISGLSLTLMLPLSTTVPLIMTYISLHGFFCTNFIGLTSVVLCDLFGVENISDSFGLVSLVRGISGSIGPLFIGHMYDVYGRYETTFYICGGIFLFGTFLHFIILFSNREQICPHREPNVAEISCGDIGD